MAEKNRLRQIRNRWLDIEQSYNVPLLYKDTEGVWQGSDSSKNSSGSGSSDGAAFLVELEPF